MYNICFEISENRLIKPTMIIKSYPLNYDNYSYIFIYYINFYQAK